MNKKVPDWLIDLKALAEEVNESNEKERQAALQSKQQDVARVLEFIIGHSFPVPKAEDCIDEGLRTDGYAFYLIPNSLIVNDDGFIQQFMLLVQPDAQNYRDYLQHCPEIVRLNGKLTEYDYTRPDPEQACKQVAVELYNAIEYCEYLSRVADDYLSNHPEAKTE